MFNEDKLREELVRVFGEHGAHVEVFDMALGRIAELEAKLEAAEHRVLVLESQRDAAIERHVNAERRANEAEAVLGQINAYCVETCGTLPYKIQDILSSQPKVLFSGEADIIHIDNYQGCLVEITLPWTEAESVIAIIQAAPESEAKNLQGPVDSQPQTR